MHRNRSIPLLCLVLLSCKEPPPPVAASLLEVVTTETSTVSLGSRSAHVLVARVPREFYRNTARPVFGRTFAEEDFSAPPTVCIISYALWEQFGSGESAAALVLNDTSLEVIGVMPEHFDIPPGAQVWIPLKPAS